LKFGVSNEDNYFHDELTVKENIIFYAEIKGVTNISKKINLILEDFELQ
jgi:ABC-type multidrug transport system ATPase subunit